VVEPVRTRAVLGLFGSGALGFLSRSGVLPAWWAKYLGVTFWACGLYWLVRAVGGARLSRRGSALAALIGSAAVEFLQLTPLPHWLSSQHWLLRAAVGESFSVWDLPAYGVGVGLAFALDTLLGGASSR
jgi:hypothetical protein